MAMIPKFIKIVIIVAIFLVFVCALTRSFIIFPMSADSLRLGDVVCLENEIRFSVYQLHSGPYLSFFEHRFDENGTVYVKFWGTMLRPLAHKLPNSVFVIQNAKGFSNVVLVD